jgi:hypothetical protein
MDPNDTLFRESMKTKKREILADDSSLAKNLFNHSDFYRIFVEENGIILFLGTEEDLITNISPYRIASDNVIGFRFHPDKNLLLYWSKKAIQLVDFSLPSDTTFFGEKFHVRSVYEKGGRINQCFWAYEDSHILFHDAGTIYLLEIEPQGENHVESLCEVPKDSHVFYDPKEHTLYYLDTENNMLKKVQIFPD